MIVKFDNREWNLDVDEIDVSQAMHIKVKTGYNLMQWQSALEQGDVAAVKALYWLMLAQNGIGADIDLVNFKIIKFIAAVGEAGKDDGTSAEANPTKRQRHAG